MPFSNKPVSQDFDRLPRRRLLPIGVAAVGFLLTSGSAIAQTIDTRHWQGSAAVSRQPEHVVARSVTEWRSLWNRVGSPAPDMFEAGRTHAVGIFLGRRAGEGYAVNVISTTRRRDRIVVVFEERMPAELMIAQRGGPRPVAGGQPSSLPSGAAGFAAAPSASASLPAAPSRPIGQPTSPWAIILIGRADLPISVEQRLFR